jgi:hypothetical protein
VSRATDLSVALPRPGGGGTLVGDGNGCGPRSVILRRQAMTPLCAMLMTLAADAASAAPLPASKPWYELLLENSLGIMIALIFVTAIIGAFVAMRSRDRCMKKFAGSAVTIIEQSGRSIWGTLRVFSKGLEVIFSDPFTDDGWRYKESFLYYQGELGRLFTVTRYVDEITDPAQKRRREKQLRRMARPGPLTRTSRKLRNVTNTFRDALVQSFGVAMTEVQKSSKSQPLKTGGKDVNKIGKTLIGEAGNAYEPMLEQYFGREVIAEMVNPADTAKTVIEVGGFLGEYSADNLLLVDCRETTDEEITIPEDQHKLLAQQLRATSTDDSLTVYHTGLFEARVTAVSWGEAKHPVDVALAPGEETTLELPAVPPAGETIHIAIRAERTFDVIIPRAIAVIRHRSQFTQTL